MKVSEKLNLISEIGRKLQEQYTFSELFAYLSAFDVPILEDGPTYSKWVYVKTALAEQSEDIVVKIAMDLELIEADIGETIEAGRPVEPPIIWKESNQFKLFISHLAKHKDKAMRLKEALEYYSISGFVAHEDIHPTIEWQAEIERGLYSMDAMVAIHTSGFSNSYWTQQEVGFALGRNVKIISLKMGEDPTGFISKHQALARRDKKAEDIAKEINDLLYDDTQTKPKIEEAQESDPLRDIEYVEVPKEVAQMLQHQHDIDFEAAGPKAPVKDYVYKGIKIYSRWGVESELKAMKRIVDHIPAPHLRSVLAIFCDSKASAVYNFEIKSNAFSHELRDCISHAVKSGVSGHNGIFFDNVEDTGISDFIDPYWPED